MNSQLTLLIRVILFISGIYLLAWVMTKIAIWLAVQSGGPVAASTFGMFIGVYCAFFSWVVCTLHYKGVFANWAAEFKQWQADRAAGVVDVQ